MNLLIDSLLIILQYTLYEKVYACNYMFFYIN